MHDNGARVCVCVCDKFQEIKIEKKIQLQDGLKKSDTLGA